MLKYIMVLSILLLSGCSDTEKSKQTSHNNKKDEKYQELINKAEALNKKKRLSEKGVDNLEQELASVDKLNLTINVFNGFTMEAYRLYPYYRRAFGEDIQHIKPSKLYKSLLKFSKSSSLLALPKALELKVLPELDPKIQQYIKTANDFVVLYNEASEYYDMKDFEEDDYAKGKKLHKLILVSFSRFVKSDYALKQAVLAIKEKRTLARIEKLKKDGNTLYYLIEKSHYLAKNMLYKAQEDNYLKLDSKTIEKAHHEIRSIYNEFKTFKEKNLALVHHALDGKVTASYFDAYHEFVMASKSFMLRVKKKTPYDFGEKMLLNTSGGNNVEGSVQQLLNRYNALTNAYNNR